MLAAWLALGAPAQAVLIDSGDGRGNRSAPPDDPGWGRMGTSAECPERCGHTFTYLGDGWFITAHHVGPHDVLVESSGQVHRRSARAPVRIGGSKGKVDLVMFEVEDPPDLPRALLPKSVPLPNSPVVMIGRGETRVAPMPGHPSPGWSHAPPAQMRWGTNLVSRNRIFKNGMHYFAVRFDLPQAVRHTEHESHAVTGDAGGAVFAKRRGQWELAGIMVSATTAHYGKGVSYIADLSRYRDEILRVLQSGDRAR